jgi:prepilin-type N-terminal cleavage/methylation domain-containing protein
MSRGFTLIELLVVIAIIGILASIILATLGVAKDKSTDSKVKAILNGAHTQSEIYANAHNNTFTGACATTQAGGGIATLLSGAASSTNATVDTTLSNPGGYNKVECHDSASAWVVDAPMTNSVSGAPRMWCVDSGGKATQESAGILANATACS